ncbi:hypothetical protein PghCCS26_61860 [Paenibacillus glycanilyticus]|uniref:Uncharacterized protein n=1 Tax=Paenibacillus glycanilyticus TaxID=126569 RepID=A0ABQ6NVD8_9BACL|nr:hypothetical protein PghCCS26_61860 [Paenibacillus glycanilyticus]
MRKASLADGAADGAADAGGMPEACASSVAGCFADGAELEFESGLQPVKSNGTNKIAVVMAVSFIR